MYSHFLSRRRIIIDPSHLMGEGMGEGDGKADCIGERPQKLRHPPLDPLPSREEE